VDLELPLVVLVLIQQPAAALIWLLISVTAGRTPGLLACWLGTLWHSSKDGLASSMLSLGQTFFVEPVHDGSTTGLSTAWPSAAWLSVAVASTARNTNTYRLVIRHLSIWIAVLSSGLEGVDFSWLLVLLYHHEL
jgi:hypothetical protein